MNPISGLFILQIFQLFKWLLFLLLIMLCCGGHTRSPQGMRLPSAHVCRPQSSFRGGCDCKELQVVCVLTLWVLRGDWFLERREREQTEVGK